MPNSLRPHGLQHARLPCPSPTPRACSNSCPLSWWCYPTSAIQPSSVVPFSSLLQSFPASGSFLINQFLVSGGQSIGASVLPRNIQDWFSSVWTGLISLQSKRLSKVFSITPLQKHQFFGILSDILKNQIKTMVTISIKDSYILWVPLGHLSSELEAFSHLSSNRYPYASLPASVQVSSVTQLCPTLCDPMNPSTPGLPVHHQLLEFTQTHVHWLGDDIQPSHPLSSPSPPAPNPSQHQSLFQWVNSSHEVAKVLEFQL